MLDKSLQLTSLGKDNTRDDNTSWTVLTDDIDKAGTWRFASKFKVDKKKKRNTLADKQQKVDSVNDGDEQQSIAKTENSLDEKNLLQKIVEHTKMTPMQEINDTLNEQWPSILDSVEQMIKKDQEDEETILKEEKEGILLKMEVKNLSRTFEDHMNGTVSFEYYDKNF